MDFNFDDDNKMPKIKKIIISTIIWIVEILLVIFLAFLIVNYTVEKTKVIGSSMAPTLNNNESILIDRFIYNFSSPKRNDVIVFKQKSVEHNYYNIKRVIGLPGEKIQIKNSKIYINGEIIEEKINVDPMINSGLAAETIILEENEYFVLGDNRNNSEDSRFASMGNILKSDIVGKARLRLSPFNFISKLNTIQKEK